jgi:hypothetical protein
VLGSGSLRTTCAATCLVWNNLFNKLVFSGTCLAGGVDYRFKCGTLEVRKVQSGRVKCGTLIHCNAVGMRLSVALLEP